jgi:hypothetical protein
LSADIPVPEDEYLLQNRSLIVGRSLLAGLAGLVPVPALDEALVRSLRRGLLLRIAERRQVDVDEAALSVLSADDPGTERTTLWTLLGSAIPVLRPRSLTRRFLVGFLVLRRLDEVVRLFHLGTLFDHYCARHHLGPGIDAAQAARLRPVFDQVSRRTQREAVTAAFTEALTAVGGALFRLPGKLYHAVRPADRLPDHPVHPDRLTDRPVPDPPAPARTVADQILSPGMLRQALPAVRQQTRRLLRNPLLNRYAGHLVRAFDRRFSPKAG